MQNAIQMQCVQCSLVHKHSHSFCIKLISCLGFPKFAQPGLLASICGKMYYFYFMKKISWKFKINEGQCHKKKTSLIQSLHFSKLLSDFWMKQTELH